jgi:hypothetical protein
VSEGPAKRALQDLLVLCGSLEIDFLAIGGYTGEFRTVRNEAAG